MNFRVRLRTGRHPRAAVMRRWLPVLGALLTVACGRQTVSTAGAGAQAGGAGASAAAIRVPGADWPEFDYNAARSGVGPGDTGIDAGSAGALRLRRVTIDGIADSSAVELHAAMVNGAAHDVAVLTTTYGKTIAIDVRSGRRLWEFDPTGVDNTPGNPQVTTAGPALDPGRRFVYSASPNGVIHKLAVATGRPVWARSITTDPEHEKLASALNVSGAWVVAVTGGYIGDIPPYDGHVVTIDRGSGRIVHVFNSECSDRRGVIAAGSCAVTNTNGDNAIWGRAGAVIEPGSGRILVATGNGPFDGHANWGDSVLELSADAGRLLHNWTPPNQAQLDRSDTDVGSTSPALLPTYHGLRLAVQGGKDGKLHLLNLARLDGSPGGAGPRLGGELGEVSAPGGGEVFTAPAVWSHGGRVYVFVATDSGSGAYQLVGGPHPALKAAWMSGSAATSPVLAGGLLYLYDEDAGQLIIRRPVGGGVVRSLPVAAGHWNSPIVAGGRIILPTGSYHDNSASSTVDIYHLPGR
ncbi:MAG: PQQ-binding-like beta-propeller repeat protein [Solirubrobacteraceae bacterium]